MTIHRRSGGTWTNPDVIGAALIWATQFFDDPLSF